MISTEFLIIGGGITNLAFAAALDSSDYLIYEAEQDVGGYCQTIKRDGFVWDYSGHFFHFRHKDIEQMFVERIGSSRVRHVEKAARIYTQGNWIDFPFQKNIHQLPRDAFIECLVDLFEKEDKPASNFQEMLLSKFGRGISDRFLIPYNEKLYACKLSALDKDAMGRFFPHADVPSIIRGFRQSDNQSYNATFTYPEGGAIVRDKQDRPTGVFIDNAQALVGALVPPPTDEVRQLWMEQAFEETARHGLTGVHDAGADLATFRRYERFIEAERFPLRVYAMIDGPGETLDYFCENGPLLDYDGRLTVRSLKLYMDGALGSRGAALLEPYADDPDNRGLLLIPPDRFETVVERAMRCGLQVNTHAIGDRANHLVLDVYERAIAETGGGPGRHRIEHAQVVVTPDDIERFAPLGVIASMQPTHATSDMPWAEDRVGPDRIRGAYAWRTFLDSGARLALGSDFPVERVSPLLGFYAAVTRQDADGALEAGWYPEQRLTRAEALRGFTLDAAYAAFMEDAVGSLEPGKRADFVVLSRDIMTVPDEEILDAEIVATYLDGAPIYGGL